jgi:hypothetical protein
MSSILKVDEIQDTSGNNIINENANTITIGKVGDTVNVVGTLQNNGSGLVSGITEADQWRVTANTTNDGSNEVTANWERCDNSFSQIGTGMTESSGVFTFPTTGIYHIIWETFATAQGGARLYMGNDIRYTTDNSSYNNMAATYGNAYGDQAYGGGSSFFMFDVTNTSTHKVTFRYISNGSALFEGSTNRNWQVATFIRLGDT